MLYGEDEKDESEETAEFEKTLILENHLLNIVKTKEMMAFTLGGIQMNQKCWR